ncbi:hypothetical protein [Halomonas alimentaria]|uniref:Uncharacterized protein n=1 Tax=Halomonas alimentaria TaxID=147248 RepID=A0A7X4W8I4_9GAMM|nr:hypothetical protein [Halomonas alimentaria]NAW34991.1 hypothetical protein [Halomonas alimentaria]
MQEKRPNTPDLEAFQALWISAIIVYARDAAAGWTGAGVGKPAAKKAYLEAVEDLFGDRQQLARLCRPAGMDVDVVAAAIMWHLEIAEAQVAAGKGLPLLRGPEAENTGRGVQV